MTMKKSNDTIGNRTRNLPACSAVPQPTAPPRAPQNKVTYIVYIIMVAQTAAANDFRIHFES
jgi:hypothetical protein